MRILLLGIALTILSSETLGAQAVPQVKRMPMDSIGVFRPTFPGIHIRESWSLNGSPAVIIDSVLVWPLKGDTGESAALTYQRILETLNPDDVEDIHVLKGDAAVRRGACEGSALIITTKGKQWRPPAGRTAGNPDCALLRATPGVKQPLRAS